LTFLRGNPTSMMIPRWTLRAAALVALITGSAQLSAQGVTTGAIGGTITDPSGAPVQGAQVQIVNKSTGYSVGALSRSNGLYLVQGLESGGPYTVNVRRIGFEPFTQNDVIVSISQTTRVDVKLSSS